MSPGKRARMPDVVRRQRTPRVDVTTVLAVVIPVVTVGVLALVQPVPVHRTEQPPALTKLTSSLVVCPSARPGSPDATVTTAGGGSGPLTVLAAGGPASVDVRSGAATPLTGSGALVVKGSDRLAPGLLAMRSGTAPVNALTCPVPVSDQWFTGVGARADHDSVIELVNPDAGPAVADITLLGDQEFSTRRLRGITVPGHKTISLDLGTIAPRRPLLTAHVVVSRGRLAVDVLDSSTDLATHQTQSEWLPSQLAPAADAQLLGLPLGMGTRTLQLANPGTSVVRADVKIVTGDTSFAPKGIKPVSIRPGTTAEVPMTQVLSRALGDGAVGVSVEADAPVTASLVTSLATDRVLTVPEETIRQEAGTLVPVVSAPGPTHPQVAATLYLSADAAGSADVTAYDASGSKVLHRTVAEQQGHTVALHLPAGTSFVRVVPKGTTVRGAIVVSGDGATVVPLHELLTQGLVPRISPGQD